MADLPHYPGAPRWVKVAGIVVGVLVLLAVIMVLAGGGRHGPFRHMSSGDADGGTPPSSLAEHPAPSGDGLAGHTPARS